MCTASMAFANGFPLCQLSQNAVMRTTLWEAEEPKKVNQDRSHCLFHSAFVVKCAAERESVRDYDLFTRFPKSSILPNEK
jgi:hypothetical protein